MGVPAQEREAYDLSLPMRPHAVAGYLRQACLACRCCQYDVPKLMYYPRLLKFPS